MQKLQIHKLQDRLRPAKNNFKYYLEAITINNFRMFRKVRFPLSFPVTVIAGSNGAGKTSLLLAIAMAYGWTNGRGEKEHLSPSRLFPPFRKKAFTVNDLFPELPELAEIDAIGHPEFIYEHIIERQTIMSKASRPGANWKAPKTLPRPVHLQPLFSMSDHVSRSNAGKFCNRLVPDNAVDPAYLRVLGDMLPPSFQYDSVQILKNTTGQRFAIARRGDAIYSEFNMASGERMVLHLVDQLERLENALVLIDEVETALHPSLQENLMRYLLDLALRRQMQIVLTTHSEVIIDAVPEEARIFLTNDGENGSEPTIVRDVIERALYGQARRQLKIICEDRVAAAILNSFLLPILGQEYLEIGQFDIGHDTGKDAFASHIRALDLVNMLPQCLFILDGDGGDVAAKILADIDHGRLVTRARPRLLCLPGGCSPEQWLWQLLRHHVDDYAPVFGLTSGVLRQIISAIAGLYAHAKENSQKYKAILADLASRLINRQGDDAEAEVARRIVDRLLADPNGISDPSIAAFRSALANAIRDWRRDQG